MGGGTVEGEKRGPETSLVGSSPLVHKTTYAPMSYTAFDAGSIKSITHGAVQIIGA